MFDCTNTGKYREATKQGYIYFCPLHAPSNTALLAVKTELPCRTKRANDGCPWCNDPDCNYGDICGEQARLAQERGS